jgi:creatinine amidohydrolase/Fe(II)-dependent formamide hydrolase-like protein
VRGALAIVALAACAGLAAATPLESLTWPELRARVAAGATTVLLPIGGTEQNGPHMVLGKHNVRVRVLAERIAAELGDAIVAPVLGYVPEGSIDPPAAHMRWPGTISISPATFEALLADAARSFKAHGFRHVVLLGDHGGYRASLERVAARLNREWRGTAQVMPLPEYHRASSADVTALLKAAGHTEAEIGRHAGLADTALAMAAHPALVHASALAAPAAGDGVDGDPRRASVELGRHGLDRIVAVSVAAIRAQRQAPRRP